MTKKERELEGRRAIRNLKRKVTTELLTVYRMPDEELQLWLALYSR